MTVCPALPCCNVTSNVFQASDPGWSSNTLSSIVSWIVEFCSDLPPNKRTPLLSGDETIAL